MSMTQIIWFSLLLCVTLAYNKTFSPLNPPVYRYPGYNPGASLNLYHTSDIVDNNLETLPDHNDDTYKSDQEQMTVTTRDDQSQEVTDGFAYNIERENTDRELLGITIDKDLFPELICNLSPFNSDTSTHNTGRESPGINEENIIKTVIISKTGYFIVFQKSEFMSVIMSDVLFTRTVTKNVENTRKRTANHLFTNVKNPIVENSTLIAHHFTLTRKNINLNLYAKIATDSSATSTA
ncbi:zinc finger protein [Loa loa]|uniref:Zinc finger protein n=1 Tax=Loa loa TaxID=7209 RepID=A0A1S0TQU3_LOALO|nr:zinc finger protein [Loa loa]EFO18264.1 zinc finger protein [Loa loa]